jgi:hypothetical protein
MFARQQKPLAHKSSAHPLRQGRLTPAASSQTHPLLNLQRKIGNQAVMRLLESRVTLQRKLTVNEPEDVHEKEADRVSEQVMRMPERELQRACECDGAGDCAKCQTEQKQPEQMQTKRIDSSEGGRVAAPSSVHHALSSAGRPLDPATRAFMEPRFGQDFSHVRMHSDAVAERSANDVNAKAYTVGSNIVFGAGSFAPHTTAGRQLIAHELAHVVQQTGTSGVAVQRQPKAAPQDFAILLDPDERFVTQTKVIAPGATVLHASSLDELVKKLKAIKGPIGTLYFMAHMTADGDILFTSPGKMTFERAEVIADKIKGSTKVENIDFRGCEIAQAPAGMEKIRTALKATTIRGSTCGVVTQVGDPVKVGGKEITKPEQLKDANVKKQFNAGLKKLRKLFIDGKDKCIINDSEAGYFQTGGKLIAVWVNPGSMADTEGWDKTKSICHKDLKVEKVDPTTKMPIIGPDDCKLLEIGKKP